jgi:PAS domain-containing protein
MMDHSRALGGWTRRIATLRKQAGKPHGSAGTGDITEAALTMCDELVRELAGAQLTRDQLQAELHLAEAAWYELFDSMPYAAALTDRRTVILKANRTAALLLNVSARHLEGKELLMFAQDRERFLALREELDQNGHTSLRTRLMMRPRERKPATMQLHVMTAPGREQAWLWFITPARIVDADAVSEIALPPEHERPAVRDAPEP